MFETTEHNMVVALLKCNRMNVRSRMWCENDIKVLQMCFLSDRFRMLYPSLVESLFRYLTLGYIPNDNQLRLTRI